MRPTRLFSGPGQSVSALTLILALIVRRYNQAAGSARTPSHGPDHRKKLQGAGKHRMTEARRRLTQNTDARRRLTQPRPASSSIPLYSGLAPRYDVL